MPGPYRFYSMPISHYCVSVDRMLAFKGLAVETVRVPYNDKTELLRDTRQDYVPALLWDGEVVPWKQIPDFLESVQPAPSLYPKSSAAVARVLEHWGHLVLEERVWRAVVTETPATFADPTERWVFEEMQSRARGPWSVLEQRKPEFEAEAIETLGLVDAMLTDRAWLLGEPSVADFGIFGSLSPWLTVGRRIPTQYPNLARWADRIQRLTAPASPAQVRRPSRAGRKAHK